MNEDHDADRLLSTTAMRQWMLSCFGSFGLSADDAAVLTDSLLFAEQRGVSSHGLSRIPVYLSRLRSGGLNPRPQPSLRRSGAVTVVDGDGGPGAVIALRCAQLVAQIAADQGIGLVTARGLGHAGALGFYAEWLAERGFVALVMGNADPIMVPPAGGRAVLGSNPLAVAVPAPDPGTAPLLDMATTAAAHGKIVMAAARGETIPSGWAVDAAGADTTDPQAALGGALLPAAGAKGFGLAFMIDVITAGLSGGRIGRDIAPLYQNPESPQGVCLLLIAIDARHCAGIAQLARATADVSAAVRQSGLEGGSAPMIPGEPERHRAAAEPALLVVPAAVFAQIQQAYPEGAETLPIVPQRAVKAR